MQVASLRRASGVRAAPASRASTVVVRAVQDLQGKVVSTGMKNSCVVAVERLSTHDKYFKRVRITKNYIAHADGSVPAAVGDYVRLEGCRPLSKNKRFRLAEVIRKAE
ncbi:rpsQ [Scenedesmus sp. PABB004]|nr:rpsQ [Scenedesmus sp. PABB004]